MESNIAQTCFVTFLPLIHFAPKNKIRFCILLGKFQSTVRIQRQTLALPNWRFLSSFHAPICRESFSATSFFSYPKLFLELNIQTSGRLVKRFFDFFPPLFVRTFNFVWFWSSCSFAGSILLYPVARVGMLVPHCLSTVSLQDFGMFREITSPPLLFWLVLKRNGVKNGPLHALF